MMMSFPDRIINFPEKLKDESIIEHDKRCKEILNNVFKSIGIDPDSAYPVRINGMSETTDTITVNIDMKFERFNKNK